MQCHLETTSAELPAMLRCFDRQPYSFRPGEPLPAYLIHFDHAPGAGREEKFEIVGQAYRLRQSKCFRNSQGRLICISCHDPHMAPRGHMRSEEHTSELQSPDHLVCRLLLEKKKKHQINT